MKSKKITTLMSSKRLKKKRKIVTMRSLYLRNLSILTSLMTFGSILRMKWSQVRTITFRSIALMLRKLPSLQKRKSKKLQLLLKLPLMLRRSRKKLGIRARASTRTRREGKPQNSLLIMTVKTRLSQVHMKKMMTTMTRKMTIRSRSHNRTKTKPKKMTMSFVASVGMVPMRSPTRCFQFVNALVV